MLTYTNQTDCLDIETSKSCESKKIGILETITGLHSGWIQFIRGYGKSSRPYGDQLWFPSNRTYEWSWFSVFT